MWLFLLVVGALICLFRHGLLLAALRMFHHDTFRHDVWHNQVLPALCLFRRDMRHNLIWPALSLFRHDMLMLKLRLCIFRLDMFLPVRNAIGPL